MKRSGYKEGYRFQMIKAAVQIYEKKMEDIRSGLIPMYRHADWEREERDKAKDDKKEHWFRSKNRVDGVTIYEAPLILDPTFDGAMKNEIANICKRFSVDSNLKVLVTERGGLKVSRDVRPDPLWDSGCGRLECECCESGDKGKCEKRSTGYEYNCQTCLKEGVTAVYYGETSKNIFCRSIQHKRDLINKNLNNALWKHQVIQHDGQEPNFELKSAGTFRTPMMRQNNEGVRIVKSKAQIVLNSRSEFHQQPIVRVFATRGLHTEQEILVRGPSQLQ